MTFQDFAQHLLAGGDRGSRRAGRTVRRDMLSMERKFGPGIPGWWASPKGRGIFVRSRLLARSIR